MTWGNQCEPTGGNCAGSSCGAVLLAPVVGCARPCLTHGGCGSSGLGRRLSTQIALAVPPWLGKLSGKRDAGSLQWGFPGAMVQRLRINSVRHSGSRLECLRAQGAWLYSPLGSGRMHSPLGGMRWSRGGEVAVS